jgi:hypothetical protein
MLNEPYSWPVLRYRLADYAAAYLLFQDAWYNPLNWEIAPQLSSGAANLAGAGGCGWR